MDVNYCSSYESVLALATKVVVDNPRSPIIPLSCVREYSCCNNNSTNSNHNNNETVPPLVPFAKCMYHRRKRVFLDTDITKGNDDRENSNNDSNTYHHCNQYLHPSGHDVIVKKKKHARAVTEQHQKHQYHHQHQQRMMMKDKMHRHGTDMYDNYSGTIRKNTVIMSSSSSSSLLKNGSCCNTSRTRLTGSTTICNDLAPKMPCRRLSIQSALDVLTESLRLCDTMTNNVDRLSTKSTSSYPCNARQ